MTLPVVEIFGPTIQGEGPAAGCNAAFLRLGGCNLSCSWCDTPYSWDGSRFDLRAEITPMTVADIMAALPVADIIVITGGEPLLYQHNSQWVGLLRALATRYREVHVETNGTIYPEYVTLAATDLIVVSPKMDHAGRHRGKQDPTMDAAWPKITHAVVKVVVQTADDVATAVATALDQGWPRTRIWVMPEGATAEELAVRWPVVASAAAAAGTNATHRLHILAWSDARSR